MLLTADEIYEERKQLPASEQSRLVEKNAPDLVLPANEEVVANQTAFPQPNGSQAALQQMVEVSEEMGL